MKKIKIKHTDADPIYDGRPEHHTDYIWESFTASGRRIRPWDWFEILCNHKLCARLDHIKIHTPTKLKYPNGICVYCGTRSGTRDHLVTKVWTGEVDRRWVLTVPSCAECNSIINDSMVTSIDGRRAIATKGLRKKYRKVLSWPERSEEELKEYGPGLQPMLREASETRKAIEYRLRFPNDATYDVRYLGRSGIDDPWANGLLEMNPLEETA